MEFENYIEFDENEDINVYPDDIADFLGGDNSDDDNGDDTDSVEPNVETDDSNTEDIDPEELKVYFNHLNQMGILRAPEDFEFDGTYEKLEEALSKTKDSLFDDAKNALQATLPDDFKALIDYALAGGNSIDAYIDAYSNKDIENLDLSKLENQRKVLYECYRQTTQYKPEKITKMIDRYEELGTIEAEALDALEVLTEEKARRKEELVENARAEREAAQATIEKERTNIATAIDGFLDDKVRANSMKAFLFNPVKDERGTTTKFNQVIQSISSNPQHLAQLVDILLEYDPKAGIKLTKLEKQVKKAGVQSFKDLVREKLESQPLVKGTVKPNNSRSQFSWDDFINT
jgi:hypothetical protein